MINGEVMNLSQLYKKILGKLTKETFFKNVLTLMTGTTIAQAIPILAAPLLTRLYTPEEYGTLALFIAIVTIFSVIATFRYELAIMLPTKEEDAINILILGFLISLFVSIFCFLIIIIFDNQIAVLLNNPYIKTWLYFVPLMVLLIGLFQCMHYWTSRKREYKKLATAQVTRSGAKVATQLGVVYTIPSIGTAGLISGAIVGQLIATIILWIQTGKDIIANLKHISKINILKQAKEHKKFPLINAPHSLVNNLSSNLPVILLTSFFSSSVAGFYSLSLMVVMLPISLISNSIGQVFYQRISQAYNSGDNLYPLVIKLVKGLFSVVIVPFLLLFIFAPYLFAFLFGQEWAEAGMYTRILAPWILMRSILSPLSYVPLTLGYQAKAFKIELMAILAVVIALLVGRFLESVIWALTLISLCNFLILAYNFLWIISISKETNNDYQEVK